MAEKKSSAKKSPAKKSTASAKSSTKAVAKKTPAPSVARGSGLGPSKGGLTLSQVIPNKHSRPKRTRVGRGHGSGMVKTGGEGGKGQTVRSGGGKGPAFEGGQTPWARRLPHNRGYSQKARDIGHFRTTFAVVNLHDLADWDSSVEVTPQTLKVARKIKSLEDGVKILGGGKTGKTLPNGLRFKDVLFSNSAKEALKAAGAQIEGE
ncbi:MAG: 50S ribosomal protein L15 [Vulcanimicrobiaceae bacterium]